MKESLKRGHRQMENMPQVSLSDVFRGCDNIPVPHRKVMTSPIIKCRNY